MTASPHTDRSGGDVPESYQPFGHAWQLDDVMALAVAANETAGIPDPDEQHIPMNHTSDGSDESEEYSW